MDGSVEGKTKKEEKGQKNKEEKRNRKKKQVFAVAIEWVEKESKEELTLNMYWDNTPASLGPSPRSETTFKSFILNKELEKKRNERKKRKQN